MAKIIHLTRDKISIVDDEDYETLKDFKWQVLKGRHTFYAYRHVSRKLGHRAMYMHRQIINPLAHLSVDHINHNGLDNRRCNLRTANCVQQLHNSCKRIGTTSHYKGVFWNTQKQKWSVKLKFNNQQIHLGQFSNEIDAGLAYNEGALKYFGEFALINIIHPDESMRIGVERLDEED